jgi:SAM-dependent methyltransferase
VAESFSPDWLALREPVDHRSRPDALLPPLLDWWNERRATRVVDLGSGTGSNLRYLAPRLGAGQSWRLVDHDAGLLVRAQLGTAGVRGVASLEIVPGDLAREGLDAARGAELVTASALLDLVSRGWLDRLVEACAHARAAALLALSWDGVMEWDPADPDDRLVTDAVRAHQRRDKGTGPALGPTAGPTAERAFADAGYRTRLAESPWILGPQDRALVLALVDGWESAAAEQRPEEAARVRGWAELRRRNARHRPFTLTVGHFDLLALPPKR